MAQSHGINSKNNVTSFSQSRKRYCHEIPRRLDGQICQILTTNHCETSVQGGALARRGGPRATALQLAAARLRSASFKGHIGRRRVAGRVGVAAGVEKRGTNWKMWGLAGKFGGEPWKTCFCLE